jgi:hypothetical protein
MDLLVKIYTCGCKLWLQHFFFKSVVYDVNGHDYTESVTYEWLSKKHWQNEADRGKYTYLEKTCLDATFSTSGVGQNLGLHADRPATNTLSHSTAQNLADG